MSWKNNVQNLVLLWFNQQAAKQHTQLLAHSPPRQWDGAEFREKKSKPHGLR